MKRITLFGLLLVLCLISITCRKSEFTYTCDPTRICLIYPYEGAVEVPKHAVFRWHRFENISRYEFEIGWLWANEIDFGGDTIVSDTFYRFSYIDYIINGDTLFGGLTDGEEFYWRVRGFTDMGDTTAWSDTLKFYAWDCRADAQGVYDTDQIIWNYNYPFPYSEYVSQPCEVTITKLAEQGLIRMQIPCEGIDFTMRKGNSLMSFVESTGWEPLTGVKFYGTPIDSIDIRRPTHGWNPPYHYGGEFYRGRKRE